MPRRSISPPEPADVSDEEFEMWLAMELGFAPLERPFGKLPGEVTNPAAFQRQGSNSVLLVGMPGFEPGASASRKRPGRFWAYTDGLERLVTAGACTKADRGK